jgi:mannose-6-phosphate isomerase-like protein (cupin superfamily)
MLSTLETLGQISKQSERYEVRDDYTLDKLQLSSSVLYPDASTNGHRHDAYDEIFIFQSGEGGVWLRYADEGQGEVEESHTVLAGTIISVPAGTFHKVINWSQETNLCYIRVMNS